MKTMLLDSKDKDKRDKFEINTTGVQTQKKVVNTTVLIHIQWILSMVVKVGK